MGKFAGLAERIGKTFEQEQVIFRQGDTGDFMYFIYHGVVEVAREQGGERVVLGRLESGEFFGEMALVDAKPRSATVTAVAGTRVIPISRDFFRRNIRRDVGFIFQLLEALSRRLEQTNDLLRRRFSEGKPPAIPPWGRRRRSPRPSPSSSSSAVSPTPGSARTSRPRSPPSAGAISGKSCTSSSRGR